MPVVLETGCRITQPELDGPLIDIPFPTVCVAQCSSAVWHYAVEYSISMCIGPANVCARYTDYIDMLAW